ncbi:nicotinate (nicotinamide) nucleotide adenylyltransferase [Thermincola ferriacetica]|uniref:Probable nicotinate-nucleotide adenylyltransferase n=1 Tax=Thermincola ferriacetica TaxID=281456 RepID=A0A0L6W376_9FIRM|nr:nicotinate-nucleotide adenylyltransferase [Thermincola ferriacetica]KNZ69534.1 nicotinate (nicotinamide) nucleotide adenylyltransferase [Thermincola ferriacetica]
MIQANERRIGLMGGTFNPIHLGHLIIAEFARHRFGLEKVIFIPAKEPPHKEHEKLLQAEHRCEMVRLAVESNPYFEVSREELDRQGLSYSVDTVKKFYELFGSGTQLYFILGADAMLEITTWKNVDKVMKLCYFAAATRPGYTLAEMRRQIEGLPPSFQGRIFTFEIPRIDISSTDIRHYIKNGEPIKYLVPECVEKYIERHKLYR